MQADQLADHLVFLTAFCYFVLNYINEHTIYAPSDQSTFA